MRAGGRVGARTSDDTRCTCDGARDGGGDGTDDADAVLGLRRIEAAGTGGGMPRDGGCGREGHAHYPSVKRILSAHKHVVKSRCTVEDGAM